MLRPFRACRTAGMAWLRSGFSAYPPDMGRVASRPQARRSPPTCASERSSQSRSIFEHGDDGRVSDEPLGARGARTQRGGEARALRMLARSCASSIRDARLRGRTIWMKPKPLTAVRSNGCGKGVVDRLQRPPDAPPCSVTSAGRCRSSRRCRAGGSRAPLPLRRAPPSCSGRQDSRRRRSGSSPASAKCEAHRRRMVITPVRASSTRSFQPAVASSSRRAGNSSSRAPSLASAGASCGRFGETRASGRFHGSVPGIASRVTSIVSVAPCAIPGSAARQHIFAAALGYGDCVAPLDAVADQPGLDQYSRPAPSHRVRPAPR